MPIKSFKPTTPGRRFASVDAYADITKSEPEKSLIRIKKRTGGRNNQGKITVRHRGGGARRFLRLVDNVREKFDVPARVEAIEYDPARGARIALLVYRDGERRYMVAPEGIGVGQTVVSSKRRVDVTPGNRMPLSEIPVGMTVHDLEILPGQGGRIRPGFGGGKARL